MLAALEDAGLKPGDIDYINVHATSTPQGDPSELIAIRRVFGPHSNAHVSATKSMTGHLLGAAGAAEAIACIKAVQENMIPATINTKNIEPEFSSDINFVLNNPLPKTVNYAMNNTFGFGGHTATTIIKKSDHAS